MGDRHGFRVYYNVIEILKCLCKETVTWKFNTIPYYSDTFFSDFS